MMEVVAKKQKYAESIRRIVDSMKIIIGPVAVTQANQVPGLEINDRIVIEGDPAEIIRLLINKYEAIIGPVAITIAKKEKV